jgi:hypothetical protein
MGFDEPVVIKRRCKAPYNHLFSMTTTINVNQLVVGSIPTIGASFPKHLICNDAHGRRMSLCLILTSKSGDQFRTYVCEKISVFCHNAC